MLSQIDLSYYDDEDDNSNHYDDITTMLNLCVQLSGTISLNKRNKRNKMTKTRITNKQKKT